jgi:very-short-patch-repair endonuclease
VPLESKFQIWQQDLLDMSRANNLVYYGVSSRSRGIQLHIDAAVLFRQLAGSKVKPFAIRPEQTDDPENCDKRLIRLRSRARDAFNDRGTHVLYVAFGVLEWKESATSEEIVRSPLVLVPVELKRQGALGDFLLDRDSGEEIEINPTLAERLKRDFGVELPAYQQICDTLQTPNEGSASRESVPSLTEIFAVLADATAGMPTGCLGTISAEVHLGIFSFYKLVMYQDLKRHTAEVLTHPVLRLIGGEPVALPLPSGLYEAGELDQHVRPHDVLEILDADSSQQEAIVAAKAGASFVLRGPPGTGKSQTISNIIAECLGLERSVLFVSEKRAALEVVGQRLRDAGLGEFCLELHSHTADKKAFIADIARAQTEAEERPSLSNTVRDWQGICDSLQRERGELNDYVEALHRERMPLGRTVFEAYATLARLANTPDVDAPIAGVLQLTSAQHAANRQELERLLTYSDVLDAQATHPWRETLVKAYSHQLEGSLRYAYNQLIEQLDILIKTLQALADPLCEQYQQPRFTDAACLLRRAEFASRSTQPPENWLGSEALDQVRPLIASAHAQSTRYRELRLRFDQRFEESALALDHAALLHALDEGVEPVATAMMSEMLDPHQALLDERALLDETLRQAVALLPALANGASELARVCCQPEPTSLAAISELLETADWLLQTPKHPAEWLDRNAYAQARVVALDARDRYLMCSRQREALSERFNESFFALDIPTIAARFRKNYSSVLRYFQPAYYSDLQTLRANLRNDEKRAYASWKADIFLAEKLVTAEAELAAGQREYATALGTMFDGVQTDWQQVTIAVQWMDQLSIHYPGGLPQELVRLTTGPSRGLKSLRSAYDHLLKVWDQWQETAAHVEQVFLASRLQAGIEDLADAEPTALHATLSRIHETLGRFWQAADAVIACERPASSGTTIQWSTLCEDLRLAQEVAAIKHWFIERRQALADVLGHYDAGLETDWTTVDAALAWAESFVSLYDDRQPPDYVKHLVSISGDRNTLAHVGMLVRKAQEALERIHEHLRFSDTVLPRDVLLAPASSLEAVTIADLRKSASFRLAHLPELERWVECQGQCRRCEEQGLGAFLAAGLHERSFPHDLPDRYEKRFLQLWLDAILQSEPVLEKFRGELHEQIIRRFRTHDKQHIQLARERLYENLVQMRRDAALRAAANAMTPLGVAYRALQAETKKRRHRSIRQIVRQMGPALIRLKPCWMMSPLSISQYVESGDRMFDLVIFDEASQICPEDAICAIFRGAQLIVVGDEKQLPPTRFFTRTLADLHDDEEETDESALDIGRTQSILDECAAVFNDSRMLRWHYRSRHESLIAFSNAHFYANRLQTFPGLQVAHHAGVRFEYVREGVYDRGGSRTNRGEAQRVVDLAIEQLQRHPDKSLGVVALSESQQMAIRDEIERRLHTDRMLGAELERQLSESDDHGFFVKNLESVQGDERDVIILSVGYGKDASGKMYYNFGPVNKEGGERRLNVAVTRAREQMILVTSIRASDLPADLRSIGARTLRHYLEYAEKGPSVLADQVHEADGSTARSGFDSPFEQAVYEALTARGLKLDTQVGCSGYYIDLAIHDPSHPGRYLLGIECDGATYHSAKTARDRDRLRQHHLESLGWRIHRIWSRDWVRNPAGEIEKVIRALDDVRSAQPTSPSAATPTTREPIATRSNVSGTSTTPIHNTGERTVSGATDHAQRRSSPSPRSIPSTPSTRPQTSSSTNATGVTHICETCASYRFHTASRFFCAHDAAYRLRDSGGRTAGCPAWRQRA